MILCWIGIHSLHKHLFFFWLLNGTKNKLGRSIVCVCVCMRVIHMKLAPKCGPMPVYICFGSGGFVMMEHIYISKYKWWFRYDTGTLFSSIIGRASTINEFIEPSYISLFFFFNSCIFIQKYYIYIHFKSYQSQSVNHPIDKRTSH